MLSDQLLKARASLPPCVPPFWAMSGHAQTIMGHLLPSPLISEAGEELQITLEKEEERIHSTYLKGKSKFVIYLFHGL
jgi:hypothetical protein